MFSHGALPFWEDEEVGGDQTKLKAFSLCSKKRIYLVGFRILKHTDLSVVEGDAQSNALQKCRSSGNSCSKASAPGQLSWRFQALTGDKQQITAESSQERPQVGECCCSQGGKSWIREGRLSQGHVLQQNIRHLVFLGRADFVPLLGEGSFSSDHSVLHLFKDLHHFSCWDAAFPHDGDATFPERK